MKYNQSIIPDIKEKIEKFLKYKGFVDFEPINDVFNDPTRRTYFSTITDKNNRKYFIKIRTLDLEFDKQAFKKQLHFGNLLNSHPEILLNNYTPKLIEGDLGDLDYLLYEYIEGENLGSRTEYGVLKFDEQDISELYKLIKSLLTFPVNLLTPDYEIRGSSYYKSLLTFASSEKELVRFPDIDWLLLDKEARFFSHGDFKPNNFLKTAKGLMIVDFEQASISNPLADIVSYLAYVITKPQLRQEIITDFTALFKNYFIEVGKFKKMFNDLLLIQVVFEYNALKNVFDGNSRKYKISDNLQKFLLLREEDLKKIAS